MIADLRAGALRSLVFTMPGGRSWALPLYELALLGATELAKAAPADPRSPSSPPRTRRWSSSAAVPASRWATC